MATYTPDSRPSLVAFGDTVIFPSTDGGEDLVYQVKAQFLNNEYHSNSAIFSRLGLDRYAFCRTVYGYGYSSNEGSWPIYNPGDFITATKIVNALYEQGWGSLVILPTDTSDDGAKITNDDKARDGFKSILYFALNTTNNFTVRGVLGHLKRNSHIFYSPEAVLGALTGLERIGLLIKTKNVFTRTSDMNLITYLRAHTRGESVTVRSLSCVTKEELLRFLKSAPNSVRSDVLVDTFGPEVIDILNELKIASLVNQWREGFYTNPESASAINALLSA
jgi:hypothetical protein